MKNNEGMICRCSHCGLQLAELEPGRETALPVHCGAPMTLQQENTIDASREKHVPVIRQGPHGVIVEVGSAPHPMTEAHFIEWIELSDGFGSWRQFLLPGDPPRAEFPVDFHVAVTARISCNLHGLWKNSGA